MDVFQESQGGLLLRDERGAWAIRPNPHAAPLLIQGCKVKSVGMVSGLAGY
jgi:hypothetical protein